MRKLALLATVALVAAGCRGKPKHQDPPSGKVEQPGSGAGSGPKASPDLVLPKGPGTPPVKTTKPIDADTIKRLEALQYNGFKLQPRSGAYFFQAVQETNDHPKIKASIDMRPCVPQYCSPMELAPWQARSDELKHFLSDELKAAPDTVFQIGLTKLHGQTMVFTYQLGQVFKADGHGSYTDMYVLYFNDGVNMARVEAHYADDPLKDKDAMLAVVSKQDLESVAVSFMDVYTQAWAPK